MHKNTIFSAFVLAAASTLGDPVDDVNLFIGTAGTGHTTPAAAYPLGMIQAGPDTGTGDWAHCSGYHYDDTSLHGFTQTHLSGTGCVDLGDVRLLPYSGSLRGMAGMGKLAFDKKSEVATPGYYAVTLKGDIRVEVTASEHAAIYRITYNGTGECRLLADCQWGLVRESRISREVYTSSVRLDGKTGFSGTQLGRHWVRREYAFVVEFDHPCASARKLNALSRDDAAPRYDFDFALKRGEPLYVKVALSAKSVDAARRNLKAEIPAWDFEGVRAAARKAWNDLLSRTTIVGTEDERANWYTGLYHLYFQPNNIADVGEKPYYSTFSTWDTFRAAGPLYTILTPATNAEFVDSMLRQGRVTGYLPIWTLWGVDNQCMIGTHSIPMIVDEFLKEAQVGSRSRTMDVWEAAYQQIKETLTMKHERRSKERWDLYDKYGYYPYDEIRGESVSRTVECGYDDWCAAQMAKALGHEEDAAFFMKRSNYWKNVFDPEIKMLRGKDTKGAWRTPYDPYVCGGGAGSNNDFTEGNSFHYTWHILQDPEGLMAAMGGKDAFTATLDKLFTLPISDEMREEETDCTGLIGQYAHGNEPSHHIVYLYTLAGHPEKAASWVREICRCFYEVRPGGLCGNEDCGQMSAWYLFSAMGFYPLNPCGGEYVIAAPQLKRVEISLGEGKTFTIIAKNLSEKNKYVKSVTLNGKPITDWKLRHADIMRGGELVFEMVPLPENSPTTVRFTSGGDKYQVAVDCLAAQDLQPWVETKLKPVLSQWIERLADDFACDGYEPKTSFVCTLVRELHCPGCSNGEGLKLNARYIREHQQDTGMVIHEIWHQLQNYQSECPSWLSEGIDDWVRYYHVEQKPPKVDPKKAKADGSYWTTAAFLEWCGGKPFVTELVAALRQGRYTPDWWKTKTGRTFEELAAEWSR